MGASGAKAHETFSIEPTNTTSKETKTQTKTNNTANTPNSPNSISAELDGTAGSNIGQPHCSVCGGDVELDDPNDDQSWAHSYYVSDHNAQVDPVVEGLGSNEQPEQLKQLDEQADAPVVDGGVLELDGGEPAAVQVLGPVAEVEWDEYLTPVPDVLPVGDPTGVALLAGGADVVDSTVTMIAYGNPDGTGPVHEVLHTTVTPDAEQKLRAALGLSETVMVPIEVAEEQTGPVAADTAHGLFVHTKELMKQTNKAIKNSGEIPASTKAELVSWGAHLDELADNATGDELVMVNTYRSAFDPYAAAATNDTAPSSILPKFNDQFMTTSTVMVTKMAPAPPPQTPDGVMPARVRSATRIRPTYDADTRTVTWDGSTRDKTTGQEYAIDLGDGYSAVYRPYEAETKNQQTQFTLRGQLEVLAPEGSGHAPELLRRLGRLNIVNRPLTGGEGEWTYLQRNIAAQGLRAHPEVTAALAKANGLEDAQMHVLIGQHAHKADGLNEAQLSRFASQLTLDAEAASLPDKVRVVRDGIAKATGHPSGDALADTAGYQPTPSIEHGWLTWSRFDAVGNATVDQAWKTRRLEHHITGGNMFNVVASGVLASTERRQLMGIKVGTMSPEADKHSGGATSVFLRVKGQSSKVATPAFVWDDPTALIGRSDWYAFNTDSFGAVNPESGHSTTTYTTNPLTAAHHTAGSNEIMFRNGIDLHGPAAPSRIICSSPAERDKIRAHLTSNNITHIGHRTVNEVVQCP
jgi:hypothetical protein